jgi:hypothetical protein
MNPVPGADGAEGGHRALTSQKDQTYRKNNRLAAYPSTVFPSRLARGTRTTTPRWTARSTSAHDRDKPIGDVRRLDEAIRGA